MGVLFVRISPTYISGSSFFSRAVDYPLRCNAFAPSIYEESVQSHKKFAFIIGRKRNGGAKNLIQSGKFLLISSEQCFIGAIGLNRFNS